jgi:hypothetical protein
MKTIRFTMAQALVQYLIAQRTVLDGEEAPPFAGVFAIFGQPRQGASLSQEQDFVVCATAREIVTFWRRRSANVRGAPRTSFCAIWCAKTRFASPPTKVILDFSYSITIVFDCAGRVALDLPATQYLGAGDASTHNEEYR